MKQSRYHNLHKNGNGFIRAYEEIDMRIYITKTNGLSLENPLQYRQWMIAEIAHGLGCREMGILCYNGSAESDESLKSTG